MSGDGVPPILPGGGNNNPPHGPAPIPESVLKMLREGVVEENLRTQVDASTPGLSSSPQEMRGRSLMHDSGSLPGPETSEFGNLLAMFGNSYGLRGKLKYFFAKLFVDVGPFPLVPGDSYRNPREAADYLCGNIAKSPHHKELLEKLEVVENDSDKGVIEKNNVEAVKSLLRACGILPSKNVKKVLDSKNVLNGFSEAYSERKKIKRDSPEKLSLERITNDLLLEYNEGMESFNKALEEIEGPLSLPYDMAGFDLSGIKFKKEHLENCIPFNRFGNDGQRDRFIELARLEGFSLGDIVTRYPELNDIMLEVMNVRKRSDLGRRPGDDIKRDR